MHDLFSNTYHLFAYGYFINSKHIFAGFVHLYIFHIHTFKSMILPNLFPNSHSLISLFLVWFLQMACVQFTLHLQAYGCYKLTDTITRTSVPKMQHQNQIFISVFSLWKERSLILPIEWKKKDNMVQIR